MDRGFYFSYAMQEAGIPLKFKYYSYRWHYSYAAQMHHKYMLIDGDELFTGSYNLSMNAEQATFENLVHLRGRQYADLVAQYEDNFSSMWNLGRDEDSLSALRTTIQTSNSIPMVFDSMALTWSEFNDLRNLIRSNCAQADSTEFRAHPALRGDRAAD